MRILVFLAFSVVCLVAANAQSQPSFECGQHRTRTERTICADDTLASLDRLLADIYARSRANLGEHEAGRLRSEQRRWLADRNRCGASAQCIATRYRQRIQALQARYRSTVVPPGDAAGPSFDCSTAATSVDRAICANPDIAQLDNELASIYSSVRRSLSTEMSAQVLREQRSWLQRRDTCGSSADCLLRSYRERIAELAASASASYPARAPGAQVFTQEKCSAAVSRLREIAANVDVRLAGSQEGAAGEPFQLIWQANAAHLEPLPAFLVIDAPEAVRFLGKGFVPFTAGAKAPYGAAQAHDRARAFVPLDRVDGSSGKLAVRFLRAGPQSIRWSVIVAGACGEHLLNSGKEWRVTIGLGRPSTVVGNAFESRGPERIFRDSSNKFETHVFPQHFTVHSVESQDLVFRGTGTEPKFSPTGRFLTYSGARRGEMIVVDLFDGTEIASALPHGLAWLRKDSLLLVASVHDGIVLPIFLLQEFPEGDAPIVGGWAIRSYPGTAARITLDLDTLTLAYSLRSGEGEEVLDLARLESLSDASGPIDTRQRRYLSAVLWRHKTRAAAAIAIADRLDVDWDLGEPIRQAAASNIAIEQPPPDAAQMGPTTSRARRSELSIPQAIEAFDLTGVFQRIHQTITPLLPDVDVRDEHFDTDPHVRAIYHSLPRNRELTREVLDRILKAVPAARDQFHLGPPEDWQQSGKVEPGFIRRVWSWGAEGDETFVVLYYWVTGRMDLRDGGIVIINKNARTPTWKLHRELMTSAAGDGEGPLGWGNDERLTLVVRPLPENRVAIATSAGRTAAVFDIKDSLQIGRTIELARPELTDGVQLTEDQRFIVTARIDGSFEFRSIRDGSFLFSGAYVDDELIVMLPDGRYDATYEGASAYRLRFQGSERMFSLDQFKDALHRPGLAKSLLAGQEIRPALNLLHVPPTLTIAATFDRDGTIEVRAQIAGGRGSGKILIHQDGALTNVMTFADGQAEVSARIRRRQVSHLLSAVAICSDGSRSVVESIPIPGTPERSRLHAVVVGINEYAELKKLAYARHDAETFAATLSKDLKIAYDLARLEFLGDREATPGRILGAIDDAVRIAQPEDTILIFFAGHGVKSKGGAFELATTSSNLPWDAVARKLLASRARVIVLLDACHAGQAERTLGVAAEEAAWAAVAGSGPPLLVLAAAKGRQFSVEAPDANGGAFTQTLAHFLGAGRRMIDKNGNGRLEISEVYGNLKIEVMKKTLNQQTPWLIRRNLVGDFPIF